VFAKWHEIQAGPRPVARFRDDQRGGTSIEYGLIVAALSVGIIWSFSSISSMIDDTLGSASLSLSERAAGGGGGQSGGKPDSARN
jgi:Flp pilus assembly pilin Flp